MGRFRQKYRIFVRLSTSACNLLYTGPTVKNYKVQNTVTVTELSNCNCGSLSCTVEDSGNDQLSFVNKFLRLVFLTQQIPVKNGRLIVRFFEVMEEGSGKEILIEADREASENR